jgi:uncharacterized protein with beta-barrel porin domain
VVGSQVQTFLGGISNSGTISGTGGIAIDVSGANNAITINQSAGLIAGAVKLSAHSDVFNITGGSIAGNIVGKGTLDTVDFNPGNGNTFTYGPSYGFAGIHQVNVTSGTVVLNGANTATGMTVSSGGTLAGSGTIVSSLGILSGGTVQPGLPGTAGGTLSVGGNVSFASGATYLDTISSSGASELHVTGTASLGGTIALATVAGTTIAQGTTYTIFGDASASNIHGAFTAPANFAGRAVTETMVGANIDLIFGTVVVAGCSTNHSNSGSVPGICIIGPTSFTGNVSNSGRVTSSGISLKSGVIMTGSVTNSGTITGGISVADSTINGAIVDSGILAGGIAIDRASKITTNGTAVQISGPTFSGGISNAGTISAGGNGIFVGGNATVVGFGSGDVIVTISTFAGGITNAGAISAGGNGVFVGGNATVSGWTAAASVTISTFAGGITNSGTISAGNNGIFVGGNATASAGGNGTVVAGDARLTASVTISTFAGGIANSGTISAGGNGIFVGGNATASGIGATASVTISTFAGGITNSGTISAGGNGILVGGNASVSNSALATVTISTFSGGITNSGTIIAKTGIVVGSQVRTFLGAISNSGIISASGGTAIDVSGANNAMTIDQSAGLIAGAVKLSAHSDVFNITGGSIAGNIVGRGTLDTVNFNLGAGNTFTYGPSYGFAGIHQVNVTSGTVVLNGANTATGMTVSNGGTLAGSGTIVSSLGVLSGGTVQPGLPGTAGGVLSVGGNIGFASGATYLDTISRTSASELYVTGTASLGGTIVLATVAGTTIANGTTYTIFGDASASNIHGAFTAPATFAGLAVTETMVGATIDLIFGVAGCSTNHSNSGSVPGICITGPTSFAGNVANSGSVIASGITLKSGVTITGNVANSGTITGGISVADSTIAGTIVDSGILAGGIAIDRASKITTSATAVRISGPTFSGGISNAGTISAGGNGVYVGSNVTAVNSPGTAAVTISTFAGGITNSGTISAGGNGIFVGGSGNAPASFALAEVAISTFGGGITNAGAISAGGNGIFVGGKASANASAFAGARVTISTFAGGITNSGTISAGGNGIFVGGNATVGTAATASVTISTFAGGITNSGAITAGSKGVYVGGTANASLVLISTFAGGITNSGTIIAKTGIVVGSQVRTFLGAISNSGTISGTGGTAIDVSGANNAITIDQSAGLISGAVKLSAHADVFNITGGSIAGNIVGQGTLDTINFALGTGTFAYGAAYGFSGISQVNINSGTVVLSGTNSATTVDVSTGAVLKIGDGTAPASLTAGNVINHGTVTQSRNATLHDAFYNYGTFTDSGTVVANVVNFGSFTIAPGAVWTGALVIDTGTFTVDPGGTWNKTSASIGSGYQLNGNQQNLAGALDNFINTSPLPANFAPLFLAGNFPNALTQLDGEAATGAERSALQMTTRFLSLMLDPFVDGRGGSGASGGGHAIGFAPEEQENLPPDIALAYAGVLKAPPKPQNFDERWTAWGAAYGGANTTSGDPAAGSSTVSAATYGFASGMDYRVAPNTTAGFALAGGGTNWGLAGGLGGGRSDAMQTGVYGITRAGPAYFAAAASFTNHWFTTNRSALGDQLTANFDGQSYGARLEAGYRFAVVPKLGTPFGVTPYAALQAQDFHTPSYSESDVTGGGFGLSYAAMNATDVRSELGARLDDPRLLFGMPLILRAKVAWAHDWASNPSLNAAFESLPGSSFTVNGAPIPPNSALTSAGAELFLSAQWSLIAKFDGEFASGSQTYGGTGTLRYSW